MVADISKALKWNLIEQFIPVTSSFSVFFQVKGAINKTVIIQN